MPLNARRVLITRPQDDAERTAERVAGLGFEPVVLPLRSVRRLDAILPEGHYDVIALTSANAVSTLPEGFAKRFAGTPVACVGTRTAAAAREAGFPTVTAGGGTATQLADLIVERRFSKILYPCGVPRRPDLERALRDAGCVVTLLETYETVDHRLEPSQRQVLVEGGWDVALLYSAESAATLARHLSAWTAERLATKRFLCLSQPVADRLPEGATSEVASAPQEGFLLAMLGPSS